MSDSQLNLMSSLGEDYASNPYPARYLQLPTLIVRFLRQYFSYPDRVWLHDTRHLQYYSESPTTPEELASAIEIHRADEYRGDVHTDLPKIVVRRNAAAVQVPGIAGGTRIGIPASYPGRVIARQYFGTLTVFALSTQMGQADLIAAEVEQLLQHFSLHIGKRLMLAKFHPSQIGEAATLREFPNFFAVPVTLDYIYEDNVQLTGGNFPIRSIVLNIR